MSGDEVGWMCPEPSVESRSKGPKTSGCWRHGVAARDMGLVAPAHAESRSGHVGGVVPHVHAFVFVDEPVLEDLTRKMLSYEGGALHRNPCITRLWW